MGRKSFDVQRDHAELLLAASRLLTPAGVRASPCTLRSLTTTH